MKIGILTHYSVYNMGAQLQLSAMRHFLEDLGHETVVLTYEKNFDFLEGEKEKNSASLKAILYYFKHYLVEKGPGLTLFNVRKVRALQAGMKCYSYAPYNDHDCDAIVIGSDEVFSIDVGCNRMMYGYGIERWPNIAYAPAFGRTTIELLKKFGCYDLVQKGLQEMDFLSSRDVHTQEMIRELTGREAPLVCDPVLLYDGHGFHGSHPPIKGDYLLVYAYDSHMTDPVEIAALKAYAKRHGLKTVSLGTYHGWCDENVVCDAESWYRLFGGACCVVTDTFHGSVVAMKNHCNVAVFIRESINAFKLNSLLEEAGMTERRLESITESELERVLSSPIDYAQTDARIAAMAETSGAYLRGALEQVHAERL
jgi:hypothetical protein